MPVLPEQALKIAGIPFLAKQGQWFAVKCPFHVETTDDLEHVHGRINPDNGAYKCFVCGRTTSVTAFLSATLGKPANVIQAALEATTGERDSIPPSMIEEFHLALVKNPEYQERLRNKHGILFDDIVKWKLGIQGQRDGTFRVTVPIYIENKVVNVRRYSYHDSENKMINWSGHGKNRLFAGDFSKTDIFVTEGEFKAILMNRLGFNTCAPTGGAGSWDAEWTQQFRGKNVIIVYDTDKAGRTGAMKLCVILRDVAASIRDVILPVQPPHNDVTDFFVGEKHTVEEFQQICVSTKQWEPPKAPEPEQDDPDEYSTTLAESSHARFHNKRVKVQAVVSAKDTAPYIVPTQVRTICKADKEYCLYCHVSSNLGYEFEIKSDDRKLLDLIGCPESRQKEVLKRAANIFPGCKACTFQALKSLNIEEVRLIPQIAVAHATGEMVVRKAYTVGHGIETNSSYEITARVCVEPDSQHATLIAYNKERSTDDINTFQLDRDLTIFQPSAWNVEAVEAKLDDIYADLETNVTKIYKRRDMHMFIDLVFHSALYVPFQGKNVKGWVDALIIGDSGQGKTEASIHLSKHYKAGERVDTKRASVAGLLGGCVESAKRWFIQWGTIPLNDRRLVILEECKGMQVESLGVLTDMRSSGIAEIQKIERARTNARTRLLWISNPRSSSRTLGSYNYGVDAVSELIGNPEDIRRFDMCMAVCSNEVGLDIINQSTDDRRRVQHIYNSDLCSHLIMWAWSRTEGHIVLDEDTEQAILDAATRMGTTYSSKCPIVEPSDQRHKLLRLSAALAARTFSTDDGECLVIRKCHVEAVERFLDRIYKSKSLGYFDYSSAQKAETDIKDQDEIKKRIRNLPNAADTVTTLIETDALQPQIIMDCTEWMKDQASEFIGFLVRKQALRTLKRGGYRKTAAFIDLLKELDREGLNNKTLHDQMEESPI